MSYADYGITPNVYRPSEVPALFQREDLLVGVGSGSTVNVYGVPPTWVLLDDNTTAYSNTTATFTTFYNHGLTARAPFMAVVATGTMTPGNPSGTFTVRGRDDNGSVLRSAPITLVLAAGTVNFSWTEYLIPGPTALKSVTPTFIAYGTSVGGATIGGITHGILRTFTWNAAADPFAGTVPYQLQGAVTAGTGTLIVTRRRTYGPFGVATR